VRSWLEEHVEEELDNLRRVKDIWPDGSDWSEPPKFDLVAVDESGVFQPSSTLVTLSDQDQPSMVSFSSPLVIRVMDDGFCRPENDPCVI
jgi:hypothetical protein